VRAQVEQAQRDGSATATVYGEAGRHYHAYELNAAAEACYRAAGQRAPEDFRWPYLLGLLLEQAGRLDEAAAAFERALRPADKYYPAFIRLAEVELARGRTEAAAAALEAPRAHAPDDPALLAALGQIALLRHQPEEARRLLELALERQPRATRLHYPLGLALRALGRTDEARRHLERTGRIGVQPRDPLAEGVQALRLGENAHLMEGHAAYRAGDFRAAAAAYARAFEASGETSAGALVNLAAAEQRLGRGEAALGHLEQARALDPDGPTLLFNLGLLLRQAGRDAQAVPHLQHLLTRVPQDGEARAELTLALFALGRAAEALDALAPLAQPPRGRCAALLAALARVEAADAPGLRGRAAAESARLRADDRCRP
jgi:tetratricopeptide (TPR) repeat protein